MAGVLKMSNFYVMEGSNGLISPGKYDFAVKPLWSAFAGGAAFLFSGRAMNLMCFS